MALSSFAAEHEDGLALFVETRYRARFREALAGTPKRRERLLNSLDHFDHLDYRWAIDASKLGPREVLGELRSAGAPQRCYVLSSAFEFREADESTAWTFIRGVEGKLPEVLEAVVFEDFGTFVSCLPGRLGYFTGGPQAERFILARSGA